MKTRNKIVASALVVGVLGSLIAMGVFGLFASTTQNSGNEISTGTVAITDNDTGSAMFNVTDAAPGDTWKRCIKVTYNGSLEADVHSYFSGPMGTLGDYMSVTYTQGTQPTSAFPSCDGFVPHADGAVLYSGPLGPAAADGTWETSLPVAPAGKTTWAPGDSVVFQIELKLDPATPNTGQAQHLGPVAATWEARSDT